MTLLKQLCIIKFELFCFVKKFFLFFIMMNFWLLLSMPVNKRNKRFRSLRCVVCNYRPAVCRFCVVLLPSDICDSATLAHTATQGFVCESGLHNEMFIIHTMNASTGRSQMYSTFMQNQKNCLLSDFKHWQSTGILNYSLWYRSENIPT